MLDHCGDRVSAAKPRLATHQHCACYYRLRATVRFTFWFGVGVCALLALAWLQRHGLFPNDLGDTQDSLFPRR